jgi:adenine-specific DNA-methyltransferase
MTTEKNDIVLDFFCGSGTTCAVAHKMKRQYIGIEQLEYGENDSVIRLQNVIKGEQSGISKKLNWQGGGSFIYCELAEANQAFIDQIQSATKTEELKTIWETMKEKAFLSYKIDPKQIDLKATEFEGLSYENQQKFLIEVLDKNMLYVPYSEIEDETYSISKETKALNRKFYSL